MSCREAFPEQIVPIVDETCWRAEPAPSAGWACDWGPGQRHDEVRSTVPIQRVPKLHQFPAPLILGIAAGQPVAPMPPRHPLIMCIYMRSGAQHAETFCSASSHQVNSMLIEVHI